MNTGRNDSAPLTAVPIADDGFDDLRLTDPFPGLRKLVDSIDLDSLSRAKHAHVPYIVILLKALDRWREKVREFQLSSHFDVHFLRMVADC